MRITQVEAIHLRLPQVAEIADGTQDLLIVRVETDEGIVGHGEVASAPTIAKAAIEAPRSAVRRHGLALAILGRDPLDPVARWRDMYDASRWYGRRGVAIHAMSGIDIALWDIVGQAEGVSLARLWGQKRCRVRAYVSVLFPDEPGDAAAMTRQAAEAGFTAIKFGWGAFGRERDHDLALLHAIRDAAGDQMDIMVDAGRIWTADQAIERGRELFERFAITWLEEPLHEDDLAGYRRVAHAIDGRIAAGEADETFEAFQALVDRGVRVIQPDVGRAGGITVCREIADMATGRGAWCVPHCFGTGINLAASLHWMGAAEEAPFIEFPMTASPLRNRLVWHVPEAIDGWVPIPDRPGLGIALDPATVDEFRVQ
jgi:L-alanine-DL-glutamate epimerase-like enolase superfamily enzyme